MRKPHSNSKPTCLLRKYVNNQESFVPTGLRAVWGFIMMIRMVHCCFHGVFLNRNNRLIQRLFISVVRYFRFPKAIIHLWQCSAEVLKQLNPLKLQDVLFHFLGLMKTSNDDAARRAEAFWDFPEPSR